MSRILLQLWVDIPKLLVAYNKLMTEIANIPLNVSEAAVPLVFNHRILCPSIKK